MTDNEVRQLMIAFARLEEQVKGLRTDIDGLKSWRDLVLKIIVGAVITALVSLVVAGRIS